VTLIDAKGWYTGQDKKIILIVARNFRFVYFTPFTSSNPLPNTPITGAIVINTSGSICLAMRNTAFGGLIYGYVMMGIVSFTVDYVLTGKTQSAQLFIFTDKYVMT